MKMFDVFRMAFGAILRNKVRSFLTALGIVIGVASVIAMVHLGQAATLSVTERIASMGSNLLVLSPGSSDRGRGGTRSSAEPLTDRDLEAIRREIFGVRVAPVVTANQTLVWGGRNHAAQVIGTHNEYFEIRSWGLSQGRFFDEEELQSASSVCVLGATVTSTIFGRSNPLGETLRVGRSSCLIVGVLEAKGASMGQDLDDMVALPVRTVQQRILGNRDIRQIYISALADGTTSRIKSDVERLMRERRKIALGKEDDFNVRDMQEIADTLEGTTKTLTMLLGAIAAVSLLVGGIGIMNIMLVSVTERTREIGIRIAIGALIRDVLIQFLVEAVTLSMLGGALGVALGIAATWVATSQMNLPFVLSPETMMVGFGFSVLIGVVFGYVPARKAAHLNPIEALRHE